MPWWPAWIAYGLEPKRSNCLKLSVLETKAARSTNMNTKDLVIAKSVLDKYIQTEQSLRVLDPYKTIVNIQVPIHQQQYQYNSTYHIEVPVERLRAWVREQQAQYEVELAGYGINVRES